MKTQLLSAILVSVAILTGTFAYSGNAKPLKASAKEIAITAAFHKITLGTNLQLVLIQDENKSSIVITGDDNLVQSVNASIDKGVLSISSKKNLKNKKIKIYVPVTMLTSLELASGASVATEGIVKLADLKVLVHQGSKVNLEILGNFTVESDEDCDFVCEKYTRASVVYVRE